MHCTRKVGLFTSAKDNVTVSTQDKEKAKKKRHKVVEKLPEVGISELDGETISL